MDRGRSSGGPNQTMLLSQTISIPPFPLFKSKMTFTSNSSYLGQGDHFPHLVDADLPQPPLRRDKSKKIVLRVRPITVRFTEAGLQDFQVDLRSRIDGKDAQRGETTNISINKGKQKERELDLDHEFDEDQLLLLEDLDDSVRALKAKIRFSRPSIQDRSLRLIHSGRILSDGTRLVSWLDSLDTHRRNQEFKAANGNVGIAAKELGGLMRDGISGIRKGLEEIGRENEESGGVIWERLDEEEGGEVETNGKGKGKENQDQMTEESQIKRRKVKIVEDVEEDRVYIQCSVGDVIVEKPFIGEEEIQGEEMPQTQDSQTTSQLRGFDRLQSTANLTPEEIENMRLSFRASRNIQSSGDALLEDEETEHARALEEQWIESLSNSVDNDPNSSASSEGTYRTILEGVLTGFFFPFLPLFFLSSRSSPSSIASPSWSRISANQDPRIAGSHLNNGRNFTFSEEMKQAVVFGLVSK